MALTDTQIALLRHAAADVDGRLEVDLPPTPAAAEPVEDLLRSGCLEPVDGQGAEAGRRRFRITEKGRRALGPGPADG